MRLINAIPGFLATVALSATVGFLAGDSQDTDRNVSQVTPATISQELPDLPECEFEDSDNCVWDAQTQGNGLGTSFVAIGGEVTPIVREQVESIPAPKPTHTPTAIPTVEPTPTAAPKTVVPTPSTTPTPTTEDAPESLCDPEITDLHCDPETGVYWDDAPAECIPAEFLSPGAVAPEGIEPCDGLTIADTYNTNDGEFTYNPETGEVEDSPTPNCGDDETATEDGVISEDGESISFCQ